MHIYNSWIRNGDRLVLLTKTGIAHKESCHKLPLIPLESVRVRNFTQSKLMVAIKCWLFSHLQKQTNGKPILQFGAAPMVVIFEVKFFG